MPCIEGKQHEPAGFENWCKHCYQFFDTLPDEELDHLSKDENDGKP